MTKAHRRIKVFQADWRYQVAQIDDEWWINKVGTYGMASAQLYILGEDGSPPASYPVLRIPLVGLGLCLRG